MNRTVILGFCGLVLGLAAWKDARAQTATLEFAPASSTIVVGDWVQVAVSGTGFENGTDGGDFALSWTPNLAFVGLSIEGAPWDTSAVDTTNVQNGSVDFADVFASTGTPGAGGARFPIARLTLRATAAGGASVNLGSGTVGWSLDGGPLDLNLGPSAQIDVSTVPEPEMTAALALAIGLLRSLGVARRGRRPRTRLPAVASPSPKSLTKGCAMHTLRLLLTMILLAGLPSGARSAEGVSEINQTSILEAGGFPYTLSASGSYVLTSDLAPPPGTDGILVSADFVEIDLNGFSITSGGQPGAIGIIGSGKALVVRRGVVRGFGVAGVVAGDDSKVIEMTLTGNGVGVESGSDCSIVGNTIVDNADAPGNGNGVTASSCRIENNVINGNAGIGISGGLNVIVHNRIGANGKGGIFDTAGGSTIQENVMVGNVGFGVASSSSTSVPATPIGLWPPSTNVIGNTISGTLAGTTGGRGINLRYPSSVVGNTISGSFSSGVACGPSCLVSGNTVTRNNVGAVANNGGVLVGEGATVSGNSIGFNTGFGLTLPANASASYTNNTIFGNTVDQVVSPATLTGGAGNVCAAAACP